MLTDRQARSLGMGIGHRFYMMMLMVVSDFLLPLSRSISRVWRQYRQCDLLHYLPVKHDNSFRRWICVILATMDNFRYGGIARTVDTAEKNRGNIVTERPEYGRKRLDSALPGSGSSFRD